MYKDYLLMTLYACGIVAFIYRATREILFRLRARRYDREGGIPDSPRLIRSQLKYEIIYGTENDIMLALNKYEEEGKRVDIAASTSK